LTEAQRYQFVGVVALNEDLIKETDGCKRFDVDLIEAALHPYPKK
jgi:hypothetical protein